MADTLGTLPLIVRLWASKNTLLREGCSATQGYGMGRYGYGEGSSYGSGNRYGELQTSGSAPARPFDRYGSDGGMQVTFRAHLCFFGLRCFDVMPASMQQVIAVIMQQVATRLGVG